MKQFKFSNKTNDLFKAILSLKSVNEAERFFRDLCTIDEIQEITDRWQIAKMLDQGLTYRRIAKRLNVSTTTVSRVALWLNNGKGGYKLVLKRQNIHHKRDFPKKRL